jgi:hypothetical protein
MLRAEGHAVNRKRVLRENARLKKLLADSMLDNAALKDLLSKKNGDARCQAKGRRPSSRPGGITQKNISAP